MNTPEGFVDSGIELPGVHSGSVKWADYDNDGCLDILITGITQDGTRISKIFRNDHGFFTDINANLLAVGNSSVAWGDYNNDGLLDIALSGRTIGNEYVTKIYRNDNGIFTDINAPIMGVFLSSIAWGDMDNNGYLDLVIAGARSLNSPFSPYSAVYLNDGSSFALQQLLTGLCFASIGLCDFDNDGDLDILITGRNASGTAISRLYESTGAEANWAPYEPANLAVTENGDYLLFTWDRSIDNEQPPISLSYSINIGSSPDACDIVSASTNQYGQGLRPDFGNIHSSTSYRIRKDVFTPGATYYWGVVAIDNSFSSSGFSTEASFEAPTGVDDLLGGVQEYISIAPNPFNPSTTISFFMLEDGVVKLTIYNARGQKVKDLASGSFSRGQHQLIWDGRDQSNRELSSGVFLLKLESSGHCHTRKMMLMK